MFYELPIFDFEEPSVYVRNSEDVQQTKWHMQKTLFYDESCVYQASER